MARVTDIPECLLGVNVLHFLSAKEAQRVLVAIGPRYCQSVALDWSRLLLNDTDHLTATTRRALQHHYENSLTGLSTVLHIYTSQTFIHIKYQQLQVFDIGFYPPTYTFRGVCWSSNSSIHWRDLVTNTAHQRAFDWLVHPPWDIALSNVFTAPLPDGHSHTPPCILSIVGEPEDTICLTNFNCLYRFSIIKDTSPQDYDDVV